MRHQDEKTNHSRPSQPAPPAVSVSNPVERAQDALPAPIDHMRVNHRCRHVLMPKQLLNGADICSRFEQVSGKRMTKRMTAGKFIDPGPTDRLPDGPL